MADDIDPFASIGGGVRTANGGWIPKSMAPQQPTGYGSPVGDALMARETATAAPAAVPAPTSADPFASIGGGVQTANGGWVPVGHPDAQGAAAGGVAGAPAAGAAAPGAAGVSTVAPGAAGVPTSLAQQTANAQTYSQTPGAAPANNSTNAGTQDAVRNTYLQTLQKGTAVDTNDANFRQQADAFSAAQERARRNAIDDSAQRNFSEGTSGSGAENIERRMADEASARNQGQFEAQLVGQELTSRRDEIRNALSSLGGMIDSDQRNALARELAALDAAIKRESIAQTGQLGNAQLSLQDRLGTGALNIDMLRAMLQQQQFGSTFGLDMANSEFNNAYKLMFG